MSENFQLLDVISFKNESIKGMFVSYVTSFMGVIMELVIYWKITMSESLAKVFYNFLLVIYLKITMIKSFLLLFISNLLCLGKKLKIDV